MSTRRTHDTQPLPQPNDGPSVHALLARDIAGRLDLGVRKYGTPLKPHNGRDALRDAYEEALDLCCYLRQTLYERDGA